jgi:hypothetical protein
MRGGAQLRRKCENLRYGEALAGSGLVSKVHVDPAQGTRVLEFVLRDWTWRVGPDAAGHRVTYYRRGPPSPPSSMILVLLEAV